MDQPLSAMDSDLQPPALSTGTSTIIGDFLRWAQTAPASARAEGARALAHAHLRGDLDPSDREDALLALTALLDDPSPLVRLALAQSFADCPGAPHHIVTALAHDQSDIAAIVLSASPLLTEAELVDAVALGDTIAQTAIARRFIVTAGVAAALAEVGGLEACVALCDNPRAAITDVVLARIVERHGHHGDLREAVLGREDLDPALRHDLTVATARALTLFVTEAAWMSQEAASRLARDATDQAAVAIAAETADRAGSAAVGKLVSHLRRTGRLTPALILRAALCGNLPFFEAALSDLSGMPPGRIAGLVRGGGTLGFDALYAKAKLPPSLLTAFRAAIASRPTPFDDDRVGANLQRSRIAGVLGACAGKTSADLVKVTALLRRFDAEAAREDARAFMQEARTVKNGSMPLLPRVSMVDRIAMRRSAA